MRPGGAKRSDRVGEELVRHVASILRLKVKDPRLADVTITGAKLTDDLRQARVYFSLGGVHASASPESLAPAIEQARRGLDQAGGFIKRQLAMRLSLRFMPDLVFAYDGSLVHGARIEALLASLRASDGL